MNDEQKKDDAGLETSAGGESAADPAPQGRSAGLDARKRQSKAQQQAADEARRLRAAAKLRENLQRRKQQLRARRSGEADETNGLPAAKTDESS